MEPQTTPNTRINFLHVDKFLGIKVTEILAETRQMMQAFYFDRMLYKEN